MSKQVILLAVRPFLLTQGQALSGLLENLWPTFMQVSLYLVLTILLLLLVRFVIRASA